jgi:hypothetical protein
MTTTTTTIIIIIIIITHPILEKPVASVVKEDE